MSGIFEVYMNVIVLLDNVVSNFESSLIPIRNNVNNVKNIYFAMRVECILLQKLCILKTGTIECNIVMAFVI